MRRKWVFYYQDTVTNDVTIYDIQVASNPERTKAYRRLQNLLNKQDDLVVGHMTVGMWNTHYFNTMTIDETIFD